MDLDVGVMRASGTTTATRTARSYNGACQVLATVSATKKFSWNGMSVTHISISSTSTAPGVFVGGGGLYSSNNYYIEALGNPNAMHRSYRSHQFYDAYASPFFVAVSITGRRDGTVTATYNPGSSC